MVLLSSLSSRFNCNRITMVQSRKSLSSWTTLISSYRFDPLVASKMHQKWVQKNETIFFLVLQFSFLGHLNGLILHEQLIGCSIEIKYHPIIMCVCILFAGLSLEPNIDTVLEINRTHFSLFDSI